MRESRDESELIEQLREGDEEAYRGVITTHEAGLLRHVKRFERDHSLAEEIVQETFLGLFKSIKRYRGDTSLKSWLYLIAGNKAKDAVKRSVKEGRRVHRIAEHYTLYPHSATRPDHILDTQSQVGLVLSSFSELPPRQEEALRYTTIEDYTLDQAAERMGITNLACRVLVCRARKRLTKIVEGKDLLNEAPVYE
jgi:RNA polymerase sigma-70 factor, ECF subfamily